MPFSNAADCRIAAHLPDGVAVHGQQNGAGTQPSCRQCRFGASVPGADDSDVKIVNRRSHELVLAIKGDIKRCGILSRTHRTVEGSPDSRKALSFCNERRRQPWLGPDFDPQVRNCEVSAELKLRHLI